MFNVLLQVLDDGRLTDSQGRTVDFTNTIIVMTQQHRQPDDPADHERRGHDGRDRSGREGHRCKRSSCPSSSTASTRRSSSIRSTASRSARSSICSSSACRSSSSEQDIRLEVTDAAEKAIADEGYDPTYGARPLKRVIQQRIQNPLATELLKGNIPDGSGVKIDFAGDEFTLHAHRCSTRRQRTAGQIRAAANGRR